jgi:hypothetical protein
LPVKYGTLGTPGKGTEHLSLFGVLNDLKSFTGNKFSYWTEIETKSRHEMFIFGGVRAYQGLNMGIFYDLSHIRHTGQFKRLKTGF